MTESGARGKSKGALSGAAETISDAFNQARSEGSERETESRPRARKSTSSRRKEEQE
jgi:hypothetical protein